jgi:hypothetical protein
MDGRNIAFKPETKYAWKLNDEAGGCREGERGRGRDLACVEGDMHEKDN